MGKVATIILRHIQLSLIVTSILCLVGLVVFGPLIPYVNLVSSNLIKAFLVIFSLTIISTKGSFRTIGFLTLVAVSLGRFIQGESVIQSLFFAVLFIPKGLIITLEQAQQKMLRLVDFFYHYHFGKLMIFLVGLLVLFFYRNSLGSYFEGDEWVFFRFYAPSVKSDWWMIQGFLDTFSKQKELNFHITPLSNMLYVIQYKLFGLNFTPYILSSLFLHLAASLSVCFFVLKLSKSKKIALITTLIFATASTHSQAVTWVVASIYTILAVIFGMLSLGFLLEYLQKYQTKKLIISYLLLFLALISKETAITYLLIFPVLYWLTSKKPKLFLPDMRGLLLIFLIFVGLQLPNIQLLQSTANINQASSGQPWSYSLVEKISSLEIELKIYRYFAFTGKALTQSIISPINLFDFSSYVTKLQLPFFYQEAAIGGMTYLNFIQLAGPELISYGISLVVLLIIFLTNFSQQHSQVRKIAFISFLLSIFAILAITVKFPWWGYSAIIDSRHLYHLTPFVFLLLTLTLVNIFRQFDKTTKLPPNLLLALTLMVFIFYQYTNLQATILNNQQDLALTDRKTIVKILQEKISPVPEILLIHTTSNRSYYGFAEYMLPFQIAVSHILPVLFSDVYHLQGADYPASFYDKNYMKNIPGGLVTQGYHQADEYVLGYYLDLIKLTKTIEQQNLPVSSVYSFKYDGDSHSFDDQTAKVRDELKLLLESRTIFANWLSYQSEDEKFFWQADPRWKVIIQDDKYLISGQDGPIVTIEILPNELQVLFSNFVSEQIVNGQKIGTDYLLDYIYPDLDKPNLIYIPVADQNVFFTVGGNNLLVYKFEVFNSEQAKLMFRTFEFID